jgi:aspartate aminotransferase
MNQRAAELRATGVDVYAFGVGEPDFEPPPHVLAAAKSAIDKGCSKYTAVTGIPQLKEAICASTARSRGWKPTTDMVCISVGAKHALFNIAVALYEPGDEVVIPAPFWVSYPEQVRMMGAEPRIVSTSEANGWRMTPAELERAVGPKTKAIILCTPCNPSGCAYVKDDLVGLLDVVRKSDCWLVVDEIYAELIYDGLTHSSAAKLAPDLHDRLVVIDGVSKTYAMTGWRIGWSLAPRALTKQLDTVQGQSTTNASAVAQHAAVAALTGPQEDIPALRARFQSRRDAMVSSLNQVPGVKCRKPEGAFYAFADCRGLYGIDYNGKPIANDEDIAFWLLEKAHVASVPGGAFGAPGYIRFSYATSEARIVEGIGKVREAVGAAKRNAS